MFGKLFFASFKMRKQHATYISASSARKSQLASAKIVCEVHFRSENHQPSCAAKLRHGQERFTETNIHDLDRMQSITQKRAACAASWATSDTAQRTALRTASRATASRAAAHTALTQHPAWFEAKLARQNLQKPRLIDLFCGFVVQSEFFYVFRHLWATVVQCF